MHEIEISVPRKETVHSSSSVSKSYFLATPGVYIYNSNTLAYPNTNIIFA